MQHQAWNTLHVVVILKDILFHSYIYIMEDLYLDAPREDTPFEISFSFFFCFCRRVLANMFANFFMFAFPSDLGQDLLEQ